MRITYKVGLSVAGVLEGMLRKSVSTDKRPDWAVYAPQVGRQPPLDGGNLTALISTIRDAEEAK